MAKHMSTHRSNVDDQYLNQFCLKYSINPKHKPTTPLANDRITDCPDGYIALYTKHFEFANLRLPLSLFFLSFLKQYRLNISQLSPFGAIKVTHFEIACRALGGEPSLPLFRQFFTLGRYGDWYTVEKRNRRWKRGGVSSCVTMVPRRTTVNYWKENFFWVSADVIPFKMHWRKKNEPLNVIDPCNDQFDEKLFGLLVKHPMPLQPFPEHVLIMTGLSRNWPYANAEPIIKDGDDEIDLVKYMKKKGSGVVNVKLTSRVLAEHEVNILERTRGICYEVPGDVEIPADRMMGDSEVWKENRVETDSEGQKRHRLDGSAMGLKKHKGVRGKNVVVSSETSQSSEEDDEEQPDIFLSARHETTPKRNIVVEPVNRSIKRGRKDIVFSELIGSSNEVDRTTVDQMSVPGSDVHVLDQAGRLAQLVGSVPELVYRYERKTKSEARLREQISRYHVKMTFQDTRIAKLVKKVRKLKNLNVSTLAKNRGEHKIIEALKKELKDTRDKGEALQEKLTQVNGELELEREMAARQKDEWSQERVQLENSLKQVSSERKWLIEEGFEYVINRLHRSREFLKPLGDVQSKLWSSAAHDGIVAGYKHCKAGVALEDVELYNPEAENEFTKAVYELEHVKYPYLGALSQCRDRTLDELKALEPMGMEDEEDEVAAGGD